MSDLTYLYQQAEALAKRPIEVEQLPSGKYIVMWMRFNASPPTPGDTEEDALRNFIDRMATLKDDLPQEDDEAKL